MIASKINKLKSCDGEQNTVRAFQRAAGLVRGGIVIVNNSPPSCQSKTFYASRCDRYPTVIWRAHC